MNSSTYRFILDLHSTQSQISLPVSVGDTARVLKISLSDGGQPYIIETGLSAVLKIKRPSGTPFFEYCVIENNTTIKYEFSQNENTVVEEGVHDCQLVIGDMVGNTIAAPRFSMVAVNKVLSGDDLVLTEDDKSAVDVIVARAISWESAETARVIAESGRHDAEEQRKLNEDDRKVAEQGRRDGFDTKMTEVDAKMTEVDAKMAEIESTMNKAVSNANDTAERINALFPTVTEEDEDKILAVKGGKYVLTEMPEVTDTSALAEIDTLIGEGV